MWSLRNRFGRSSEIALRYFGPDRSAIAGIEWILPDRALASEFATVLETGYLRGADLWHVATALYVSPQASGLSFATLDARQGTVAEALGFRLLRDVKIP